MFGEAEVGEGVGDFGVLGAVSVFLAFEDLFVEVFCLLVVPQPVFGEAEVGEGVGDFGVLGAVSVFFDFKGPLQWKWSGLWVGSESVS